MKLYKKSMFPGFLVACFLIAASCTENPKSDQAVISEAGEVQAIDNATNLNIDKEVSEVTWVGTRPGKRHNGTINIESGNVAVANDELVGGSFVLDLNSIDVSDLEGEEKQKLTRHLKSADFFDVENHPLAKFEIVAIEEYTPDEVSGSLSMQESEFQMSDPTHRITGNLTMRDKTLGVTFPARVLVNNDEVQAEAKFNIDRIQWGVSYQDESKVVDKAKDKFIYNTVNVGFNIIARR
jgi:polyisoprenoid-binding protein YceI